MHNITWLKLAYCDHLMNGHSTVPIYWCGPLCKTPPLYKYTLQCWNVLYKEAVLINDGIFHNTIIILLYYMYMYHATCTCYMYHATCTWYMYMYYVTCTCTCFACSSILLQFLHWNPWVSHQPNLLMEIISSVT